MRTGEIYFWTTNKAKGHQERDKYHIFICNDDWQDGITFLFICSQNYFGDFPITKAEYNCLPNEESFISCSDPVFYTPEELQAFSAKPIGRLTKDFMKMLANHLASSETMENRHIVRICKALHKATA